MLQFDVTHALPFLPENWLSSRLDGLTEARNLLERGNGLGGAFTGWVDLPASYDPEELQRILQTARIIRGQSEVLIVIGIGGSYLGARAMLELLTSPNYNLLRKKTPQIFFTGNTLSSDALTELLELRAGQGLLRKCHLQIRRHHRVLHRLFPLPAAAGGKIRPGGRPGPDFCHHGPTGGNPPGPGQPGGLRHLLRPRLHRRAVLGAHCGGASPPGRGRPGHPGDAGGVGRRHGGAAAARPGQPRLAVRRRPQRPVRGGQAH